MERLSTSLSFNGKEYSRSLGFRPSNIIGQTPAPLVAWMMKQDGQQYKSYKLLADTKKQKQRDYLINQCIGEVGEEVVQDLLIYHGWTIDLETPVGDFKAINPAGQRFLIEVKTCRSSKRLNFFKHQAGVMKQYCLQNKLKPLFYLVFLKQIEFKTPTRFEMLDPQENNYTFKVLRVKTFNYEVFCAKWGKNPNIRVKKIITLPKNSRYPQY